MIPINLDNRTAQLSSLLRSAKYRFSENMKIACLLIVAGLAAGCSHGTVATTEAQKVATPTPKQEDDKALAELSPRERDLILAGRGEKWVRSEKINEMDGTKTVSFAINSKNAVVKQQGSANKILLSVFCGKHLSVAIQTGPVMTNRVRLKFDDGQPISQEWKPAGNFLLMFSPLLVKQLVKAKVFKFEFTPLESFPQVATFDMVDLKDVAQQEKACKL